MKHDNKEKKYYANGSSVRCLETGRRWCSMMAAADDLKIPYSTVAQKLAHKDEAQIGDYHLVLEHRKERTGRYLDRSKPVRRKDTGKVYPSPGIAAAELGCHPSNIRTAARCRTTKACGTYWEYVDSKPDGAVVDVNDRQQITSPGVSDKAYAETRTTINIVAPWVCEGLHGSVFKVTGDLPVVAKYAVIESLRKTIKYCRAAMPDKVANRKISEPVVSNLVISFGNSDYPYQELFPDWWKSEFSIYNGYILPIYVTDSEALIAVAAGGPGSASSEAARESDLAAINSYGEQLSKLKRGANLNDPKVFCDVVDACSGGRAWAADRCNMWEVWDDLCDVLEGVAWHNLEPDTAAEWLQFIMQCIEGKDMAYAIEHLGYSGEPSSCSELIKALPEEPDKWHILVSAIRYYNPFDESWRPKKNKEE